MTLSMFKPAVLVAACLLLVGCHSDGTVPDHSGNKPVVINSPVVKQPTLDLNKTIVKADRILWVGDDLTEQTGYTRAAAAALLSVFPQYRLRFYNGGKNGATVQSTLPGMEVLLNLTRPTVVFICLGLNDAVDRQPQADIASQYEQNLRILVDAVKTFPTVREVVVLGPPAVPAGMAPMLDPGSYNATLLRLGQAAQRVAAAANAHAQAPPGPESPRVDFIDLFVHTSAVYLGQMESGGSPLTLDGKWPTPAGHAIIASVVLRGIGVTGEQLDKAGWSPLSSREMGRIRPALAISTRMPSVEDAQRSRDLCLALLHPDDLFFKAWQLSDIKTTPESAQKSFAEVELAWENIDSLTQDFLPQPGGRR